MLFNEIITKKSMTIYSIRKIHYGKIRRVKCGVTNYGSKVKPLWKELIYTFFAY